jgi:hypothetical protein
MLHSDVPPVFEQEEYKAEDVGWEEYVSPLPRIPWSQLNIIQGAKIIDYSMLSAHEAELARTKAKVENVEEAASRQGSIDAKEGQKTFEDMTDLQNDEFIVSSPFPPS